MATKHTWYRPRHYLHFDPPVGYKRARRIVTSPKKVARHSFYPFITYYVTSKKIKHDKSTGILKKKTKNRPIAYASHLDSHIYSYYASKLSELYENALLEKGIGDSVLAFRRLDKSNVEFAAAAFDEIRKQGDCSAVALDISGFFDNLDHEILKKSWTSLINEPILPSDHYAVFKSLTKFSSVNKELLYTKLGVSLNNPKKDGRKKLCDPVVFRKEIRSNGLVETNKNTYGIPQGSPISALLSNIYMIKFDVAARKETEKVGGIYFRYCDDMLFIVPTKHRNRVVGFARKIIKELRIDINPDKTELRDFREVNGVLSCDKPIQYLGFTYDGQQILIRSTALARYSEKMKRGVRFAKATMRKRNRARIQRGENPKQLYRQEIYNRYSHLGKRNFIRYGIRAADIMKSKAIRKQLKPLWARLIKEIET